ncbi:unnamed protein product [Symbiodinium natans]|uniref:Uncharacterized protein n=1 Tax=Symbiodinium natans TaxID=878477 RepID=A0A812M0U3_9DINO|nr:unnamed protein product [Symbiodinium natans]
MPGTGGAVGDHFCCSQRRPSPPREHHLASVLTSKVHRYCDALQARRAHLAAVDCFFRELIACQWRLEAIETQQRALQAEALEVPATSTGAKCCEESLETGDPAKGSEVARLRRQMAVESCLTELMAQRDAAVSALEERATHYALAATGEVTRRFAAGEAERRSALQSYRHLANEVCSEACAEMQGLLEAPLEQAWLASLAKSLERRLRFWTSELEETWAAWHDATARMHNAGQDAMGAWREIAEVLECACQHFERDGELMKKPELQTALVTFAARSLEVELVNSLGLSGLHGEVYMSNANRDQFCVESRLNMLTAVLDLLSHLGALHRVGEEILSSSSAPAPQQESAAVMPTPTSRAAARMASKLEALQLARPSLKAEGALPTSFEECSESPPFLGSALSALSGIGHLESLPSAAAAVRWATAAQVTPCTALRAVASAEDLQALGHGSRSAAVLLPWLIESIVEAVCTATMAPEPERSLFTIWPAPLGQKMTAAALVQSCSVLGNEDFADAVRSAAERRLHRLQNPAGDVEEAEETLGGAKTRSLQQVTRGLSSSCARLLDLDALSEEESEDGQDLQHSREQSQASAVR